MRTAKFQRLFDVRFRDVSGAVEGSIVSNSPHVSITGGRGGGGCGFEGIKVFLALGFRRGLRV